MTLRIGTRGSALALTQSGAIRQTLVDAGHAAELIVIRTAGDRNQQSGFGSIGAQGVFVREIEQALLEREIDMAVHSYKDLPTSSPPGLIVAAVPAREDPADVLLVHPQAWDETAPAGHTDRALKTGARVGTASARRTVWLRHLRPDLQIMPLRGNVPTRVGRLRNGGYDAILLAAAGLNRLGGDDGELAPLLENVSCLRLAPREFVAAPAQGALALQCRADDDRVREILAALDDHATRIAVTAERAALAMAEGGCDTAFGAYCESEPDSDTWRLTVMLERDAEVLHAAVSGQTAERLPAHAFATLSAHPAKPQILAPSRHSTRAD
jgi:hydroxymethylbilane synthase